MTMITSYAQAVALFATARKPEAGKPLAHRGWRMYKHGDEFAIYYTTTMVARLLPGSRLRMVLPNDTRIPPGIGYKIWGVLPVVLHRLRPMSFKLHVIQRGGEGHTKDARILQACGYTSWGQLSTDGYKLYDGLTIDLVTREADCREPRFVTDAGRNKDWLRKSKTLKLHLHAVARVGGFDALWGADHPHGQRLRPPPGDIVPLLLAALEGERMDELVRAVGKSLLYAHWGKPDVSYMIKHIDRIFATNSFALRLALGVTTRA